MKELNDWVLHTRETSELRLQTEQMGRSWPNGCATSTGDRSPDARRAPPGRPCPHLPRWPSALAVAHPGQRARGAAGYAFGWAENMVQAASNPCNWAKAQASASWPGWLRHPAAADHAASLMDSERQAFSPMLAILSAARSAIFKLFRS